MDLKELFLYVLLSLNLQIISCQAQFYNVEDRNYYQDVPEVGLSHLGGYQVQQDSQYIHQPQQHYPGYVDYNLPVVGDVMGEYEYPVEAELPPVMSGYPDYPSYGLAPCNPSPSRYLVPPLQPDCPDYYDCDYQPPCYNCPCIQFDPCAPPYYCPPPTSWPVPPSPVPVTTTTSPSPSCKLLTGDRESLMVSVDGVLLWISAPIPHLTWYRADSLTAALGRETSDWRLAELSTREEVDYLEILLNREGCSLDSLNVWLGGNRLADSEWRWTTGERVTGDLWRGQGAGEGGGDCMMLRGQYWSQELCGATGLHNTVFMAQKGNFPTTNPPPTLLPPITTVRPTAKPSSRPTISPSPSSSSPSPPPTNRPTVEQTTDEWTTPIDTNLPPGPD